MFVGGVRGGGGGVWGVWGGGYGQVEKMCDICYASCRGTWLQMGFGLKGRWLYEVRFIVPLNISRRKSLGEHSIISNTAV